MDCRAQILFLISAILLTGCRSEEPNPEMLDPIYSDLLSKQREVEASLETERKNLLDARKELEDALPNTIDLKNARRKVETTKKTISKLEQESHFLTIRVNRRLVEDRFNYHIAFVSGKDWPDRSEFASYQTNARLRTAPKLWSAHLPKLFNRKPAESKEKAEKKAE